MNLKVGDIVRYNDNIEKITNITFKITDDVIDHHCAELEIEFESGRFYYDEIEEWDYSIDYIKKRLYENAEDNLEKEVS